MAHDSPLSSTIKTDVLSNHDFFCRTVSSISIEKSEPATEGPAAKGPTNIEESTSSAVLESPSTPDRESEDIAGTSSQQNAPKTPTERVRPPPGKAKKRKMDPVDEKTTRLPRIQSQKKRLLSNIQTNNF